MHPPPRRHAGHERLREVPAGEHDRSLEGLRHTCRVHADAPRLPHHNCLIFVEQKVSRGATKIDALIRMKRSDVFIFPAENALFSFLSTFLSTASMQSGVVGGGSEGFTERHPQNRYIGFVLEHYRGTSSTHFHPLPFVSHTIHFAFARPQLHAYQIHFAK